MNITNVLKDFKIKENTVLGVFSVSGDFKIASGYGSMEKVQQEMAQDFQRSSEPVMARYL